MSKFCPIVGKKVLYLDCLECSDRVCEKKSEPTIAILPKKENPVEAAPVPQETPQPIVQTTYYLIQSYRKEVDEEYQRHLYPSYMACFKMDGIELLLQSGFNDALKFTSAEVAESWLKRAKTTFQNHELQIVPFDSRVFGRVKHKYVVNFDAPPIIEHPSCSSCRNCQGTYTTTVFGMKLDAVKCPLSCNRVFGELDIKKHGCNYHNVDMGKEKICMNCENFLGGGDWGLACKADYYRLPKATSPACEDFYWRTADEN